MSVINDFKDAFFLYEDQNNNITKDIAMMIFSSIGLNLREDEQMLIQESNITFEMFIDIIEKHMATCVSNDDVHKILSTFDTFENDKINMGELIYKLQTHGEEFSQDEIDEFVRKFLTIDGHIKIKHLLK